MEGHAGILAASSGYPRVPMPGDELQLIAVTAVDGRMLSTLTVEAIQATASRLGTLPRYEPRIGDLVRCVEHVDKPSVKHTNPAYVARRRLTALVELAAYAALWVEHQDGEWSI